MTPSKSNRRPGMSNTDDSLNTHAKRQKRENTSPSAINKMFPPPIPATRRQSVKQEWVDEVQSPPPHIPRAHLRDSSSVEYISVEEHHSRGRMVLYDGDDRSRRAPSEASSTASFTSESIPSRPRNRRAPSTMPHVPLATNASSATLPDGLLSAAESLKKAAKVIALDSAKDQGLSVVVAVLEVLASPVDQEVKAPPVGSVKRETLAKSKHDTPSDQESGSDSDQDDDIVFVSATGLPVNKNQESIVKTIEKLISFTVDDIWKIKSLQKTWAALLAKLKSFVEVSGLSKAEGVTNVLRDMSRSWDGRVGELLRSLQAVGPLPSQRRVEDLLEALNDVGKVIVREVWRK